MAILGFDSSHHNGDAVFNAMLAQNPAFMILKASEGKTFVDSMFSARVERLKRDYPHIKIGAYHFVRPDSGNTPVAEMENFMKQIKLHDDIYMIRPFLDVEGKALTCESLSEWVSTAINYVRDHYSYGIGIYASLSVLNNQLRPVIRDLKPPIWLAHYSKADEYGCVHFDGEWITQHTSVPYDHDTLDDSVISLYDWTCPYGYVNTESFVCSEGERKLIVALREQDVQL